MYKIWITLLCILMVVSANNVFASNEMDDPYKLHLEDTDFVNVSINCTYGQGHPVKVTEYYLSRTFSYYSEQENEVQYIIFLLNAINLTDDGITVHSADGAYVNIDLTKTDGSVEKMGFINGRFYVTTSTAQSKQYAIKENAYSTFLDFVYGLKTGRTTLPDKISFEPSEWARTDVQKAVVTGLVPRANQINYIGDINRLEVCQLTNALLELHYKTADVESPFSDTTDKSVAALYSMDIINGKTENEFCPYDLITREELAKILSRTFHILDSKAITNRPITFLDQNEISSWAKEYVSDMYLLGILLGDENNNFRPKMNLTKEEAIVALLRLNK